MGAPRASHWMSLMNSLGDSLGDPLEDLSIGGCLGEILGNLPWDPPKDHLGRPFAHEIAQGIVCGIQRDRQGDSPTALGGIPWGPGGVSRRDPTGTPGGSSGALLELFRLPRFPSGNDGSSGVAKWQRWQNPFLIQLDTSWLLDGGQTQDSPFWPHLLKPFGCSHDGAG